MAREKMPQYAEDEAFILSGQQLKKILKGRNPFKGEPPRFDHVSLRSAYRVTQLRDGTWWVENYRTGAPLFAPDYWHKISDSAGKRAQKINEFVEAI